MYRTPGAQNEVSCNDVFSRDIIQKNFLNVSSYSSNLKLWKMTIFQFSKNSFRLEQHLEPSRGEMSNCSSRTIKTKKMVIHVRLPDCNFLCCSRACRHYYFSHGKIIFWVPRTILLLCFVSVLLLSLNCFFRFVQFRSLILSLWISFEMLVESNNAAHVFSIQPEGSSNH